ncbi:hypothetical protein VP01_4944g1 [Puccinia sorghi]|uniref:Uncharacterized protein n=1 Tax=Puccinia sorghi TaxID=27349 RepID=A0A0L6ULZ0_9BASI|nr:hypothetical protein VP01_4944g1 [Puccinia sorghi]
MKKISIKDAEAIYIKDGVYYVAILRTTSMATLRALLNMATLRTPTLLYTILDMAILRNTSLESILNMATLRTVLNMATLRTVLNMATLRSFLNMATLRSVLNMATLRKLSLILPHQEAVLNMVTLSTPSLIYWLNCPVQLRFYSVTYHPFTILKWKPSLIYKYYEHHHKYGHMMFLTMAILRMMFLMWPYQGQSPELGHNNEVFLYVAILRMVSIMWPYSEEQNVHRNYNQQGGAYLKKVFFRSFFKVVLPQVQRTLSTFGKNCGIFDRGCLDPITKLLHELQSLKVVPGEIQKIGTGQDQFLMACLNIKSMAHSKKVIFFPSPFLSPGKPGFSGLCCIGLFSQLENVAILIKAPDGFHYLSILKASLMWPNKGWHHVAILKIVSWMWPY